MADEETIAQLRAENEELRAKLELLRHVKAVLTEMERRQDMILPHPCSRQMASLDDNLSTLKALKARVETTEARLDAMDKEVSAASVSAAAAPFPFPEPNIIPSDEQLKAAALVNAVVLSPSEPPWFFRTCRKAQSQW